MIHAKSLKKRELKQYLIGRLNETCRWCNVNHHLPVCPRVKKYSFHPDGSLAGVEFYTTEEMSWRPANPLMPTFTPTTAPMPTTWSITPNFRTDHGPHPTTSSFSPAAE